MKLRGVVIAAAAVACLAVVGGAAERPKDFRGIKWGTSSQAIPGLKFQEHFSNPNIRVELDYYSRPSDELKILGNPVESIRYIAEDGKIIGVSARYTKDMQGFVSCKNVGKRLREIFGPPDETKVNKSTVIKGLVHGQEELWFANSDDEANIKNDCPAQEGGFGYMEMMWKARAKAKSGL